MLPHDFAEMGERPLTYFFVRHGATEYNLRHVRCGGDVDAPLSHDGLQEAKDLARTIAIERPQVDVVRVSPLQRCLVTLESILPILGAVRVIHDEDLIERRMGAWNGRSQEETRNAIAVGLTPPGGESEIEFRTRVSRAIAHVAADQAHRTLVISSSGVARVMHTLLGGAGRIAIPNARLVRFRAGYGADLDSAA